MLRGNRLVWMRQWLWMRQQALSLPRTPRRSYQAPPLRLRPSLKWAFRQAARKAARKAPRPAGPPPMWGRTQQKRRSPRPLQRGRRSRPSRGRRPQGEKAESAPQGGAAKRAHEARAGKARPRAPAAKAAPGPARKRTTRAASAADARSVELGSVKYAVVASVRRLWKVEV